MRRHFLIIIFILVATPAFSAGVLNFTPSPAVYSTQPGGTVALAAILSNTGDAVLNVNDRAVTFNGQAGIYLHSNPFFNFFNAVPGTFEPTDTPFVGVIEEIVVDPNTPFGTYTLSIEMIGGASPTLTNPASDGIGTKTFTIVIGSPSAPSNLTAISLASASIDLSWTDNAVNETRFELAQSDTLAVVQTVNPDVTTASFRGLDPAIQYHFYVRACNDVGCSAWVGPAIKLANGSDDPATPVMNLLTATPPGLSQSLAPYQGGSFILTVNGANFDAGATVSFGGVGLVTTRISSTQLTALVPASALTTLGARPVMVTNGGGKASMAVNVQVSVRGDTNANDMVNIGDALVCAQTAGGVIKPPLPISVGDLNFTGSADIGDCLITALFAGRVNPNFAVPTIISLSPSPAVPGSDVTITGNGFAASAGNNQVLFNTATGVIRVTPNSGSMTSLTVTVPAAAVTGPIQVYRVDSGVGGAEFGALITGSPTPLVLTSVQPFFQVNPGTAVTLTGLGFGPLAADNSVLFKSAAGTTGATVTSASTTSLVVTVPNDAICGPVTVGVGVQGSNARTVTVVGTTCSVQLTDLWGGGSPGDIVVLEGAGFDVVTPANNVVRFTIATGGTVIAPVIAAGGTQLHVRIPDTAVRGNVTVTVGSSTSNPLTYIP